MRPIHVWRSRTPDGVRYAHFTSDITTIMDHKVQLLKPLNKRELCTTLQNRIIQIFKKPYMPLSLNLISMFQICVFYTIKMLKICMVCGKQNRK
jgi:hypothetical protein